MDSAKRLITLAAGAGADAIKFQIFDPDLLVADRSQTISYDVLVDRASGQTETITESLYDLLCRRCLSQREWQDLKAHSDRLGLAFFATVAFQEDIELLARLKCDSIKIASADVNHIPLIRSAARTGMCIQLDTGNATLGEIERAIDVVRQEGNERIIIHQCPSPWRSAQIWWKRRLLKTAQRGALNRSCRSTQAICIGSCRPFATSKWPWARIGAYCTLMNSRNVPRSAGAFI
jgi:sialic acid synthase SpsE